MEQISTYLPVVYMILGVLAALALIVLIRVLSQLRVTLIKTDSLIEELDKTVGEANVLIADLNDKSKRLTEPLDEMLTLIEQVTVTLQRVVGLFVKVSSVVQVVNKFGKKERGGKK